MIGGSPLPRGLRVESRRAVFAEPRGPGLVGALLRYCVWKRGGGKLWIFGPSVCQPVLAAWERVCARIGAVTASAPL